MSIYTHKDLVVIDGPISPKKQCKLEEYSVDDFSVGDIVIPIVRVPYAKPFFCDCECRVTKVEDGRVYATLTKWNKVPSWGFRARELMLLGKVD